MLLLWTLESGTPGVNRYGSPPESDGVVPTDPFPVQLHRRTHLEAGGNIIGYQYKDDAGNLITKEPPGPATG